MAMKPLQSTSVKKARPDRRSPTGQSHLEFCDRLNALARLQKPNRLLLEIKHVPAPCLPFFFCVSLSLLKQLAKGPFCGDKIK
jgi:hypothetical protein